MENNKDIASTIRCKYVHENQFFIASNQTVWPCCFLWSERAQNPVLIKDRLDRVNGENWNSLKHYTLQEILDHKWFKEELEKSWDESHEQFIYRCFTDCGDNRAIENIIKESTDNT